MPESITLPVVAVSVVPVVRPTEAEVLAEIAADANHIGAKYPAQVVVPSGGE